MLNIQMPSVISASNGGATETVKLPRLVRDNGYCWTYIVALTNDAHKRKIRIYAQVGSGESELVVHTPATNLDSVAVPGTVYLPGSARICADFTNVDNDCSLELYAYGYEVA